MLAKIEPVLFHAYWAMLVVINLILEGLFATKFILSNIILFKFSLY